MTAGEIAALTASGAGLLLVIWLMVVLSQGILLMKKASAFLEQASRTAAQAQKLMAEVEEPLAGMIHSAETAAAEAAAEQLSSAAHHASSAVRYASDAVQRSFSYMEEAVKEEQGKWQGIIRCSATGAELWRALKGANEADKAAV